MAEAAWDASLTGPGTLSFRGVILRSAESPGLRATLMASQAAANAAPNPTRRRFWAPFFWEDTSAGVVLANSVCETICKPPAFGALLAELPSLRGRNHCTGRRLRSNQPRLFLVAGDLTPA